MEYKVPVGSFVYSGDAGPYEVVGYDIDGWAVILKKGKGHAADSVLRDGLFDHQGTSIPPHPGIGSVDDYWFERIDSLKPSDKKKKLPVGSLVKNTNMGVCQLVGYFGSHILLKVSDQRGHGGSYFSDSVMEDENGRVMSKPTDLGMCNHYWFGTDDDVFPYYPSSEDKATLVGSSSSSGLGNISAMSSSSSSSSSADGLEIVVPVGVTLKAKKNNKFL